MYLFIGNDTVLFEREVIGIFDLDKSTVSQTTRKYLKAASDSGDVEAVADELPKSFTVCENGGRQTVYLSPISVQTLYLRSERPL